MLQFYDPASDAHQAGLDVVGANYVCGERGEEHQHIEVILADIQGEWLATVESRKGGKGGKTILDEDQRTITELRLKFWKIDRKNNK